MGHACSIIHSALQRCKIHNSCECQQIVCRAEGFTLHGLWPNLDNPCPADYPEHCDDSVFNRNEIPDDVLQSMEKLWPSYSTCKSLPNLSCIAHPEAGAVMPQLKHLGAAAPHCLGNLLAIAVSKIRAGTSWYPSIVRIAYSAWSTGATPSTTSKEV